MRGGEKVLENFCSIYPDADIYTHVYNKRRISSIINNHKIHTTFINYLPFSNKLYKYYLPLMPLALKFLDLKRYDLIISMESGPTKGFKKNKNAKHVCYCHTPMRYLYDMKNDYYRNFNLIERFFLNFFIKYLIKWDRNTSENIDLIIANSNFISERIEKFWNKKSVVINPSINLKDFRITNGVKKYYLIVSHLVPYKKVDIAINAFNQLDQKLVIIGDGPLFEKYKKMANNNIKFLGWISDSEKTKYLSNCKALIFPGIEDFGLVPLEAMASGRPVIAYNKGGVLDYIHDGLNGIYFKEQNKKSLMKAIEYFKKNINFFNSQKIRKSVSIYDNKLFNIDIKKIINEY